MSIGELILNELRCSARRAHRLFASGHHDEARPVAERVNVLLASLRESYVTDSPFHQLVRAAVERGMPEAYVADVFIHDRRAIAELEAGEGALRFVWLLHECGTLLFDAHGKDIAGIVWAFFRRYSNCLVFTFEDGLLTQSTPDGAQSFALRHRSDEAQAVTRLKAAG